MIRRIFELLFKSSTEDWSETLAYLQRQERTQPWYERDLAVIE